MSQLRYPGALTALVTPFHRGAVSYGCLEHLVAAQLEGGVHGLVAVGTTGESPTLDYEEHIEVIASTVRFAGGRVPVLAGTGSNSTEEALDLTRRADRAGADAFLQVAPYYNKPSAEGLFQHFSAIAACTAKPIVLYSIPGRCGIEIPVDVIARLAERHPNVVAIKESGGSCDRVDQIRVALGDRIEILSGDDALTLPFMALGATGVISVANNVAPAGIAALVNAALAGDYGTARRLHLEHLALFKALFLETNPAPAKFGLVRLGIIASDEVRLPLVPTSPKGQAAMVAALTALSLLPNAS